MSSESNIPSVTPSVSLEGEEERGWWRHLGLKERRDMKVVVTLLTTTLALALLWNFGRVPFFRNSIAPLLLESGAEPATVDFYGYYYLAISSIVTRMVIPALVIVFVFKESLKDYGYRMRGTKGLGLIYLVLLCFMLPVLFYVSGFEAYQSKYPLYRYAASDLKTFLTYEFAYLLIFVSGESFWRGFMVHALAPKMGLYALPVMAIPYAMIHFGKPFSESIGAIITGLVLGYLALRHRSFWLGVALHATVGFSMDIFCLGRKGLLLPLFGF